MNYSKKNNYENSSWIIVIIFHWQEPTEKDRNLIISGIVTASLLIETKMKHVPLNKIKWLI